MNDHERFEMAVDRRLRGALPEAEATELADHLTTCERCEAYERGARRTQEALSALAGGARAAVDWGRIERGVETRRRSRIAKLYVGVGLAVIAVALGTWGFAAPGERWSIGLEMGLIVGAIVLGRVFVVVREVRRVSALGVGDELLATHRALLQRDVKRTERLRWVALAVVIWCAVNAIRAPEPRELVAHAALGGIVLFAWLRALIMEQPRLRRELAVLGG